MSQCTCGRGFTIKIFTSEPRLDNLCPICISATTPELKEEYTLEQLELAYEQDLNNSFLEDRQQYQTHYSEVLNYG